MTKAIAGMGQIILDYQSKPKVVMKLHKQGEKGGRRINVIMM
jgi:hypothetical protein